MTGPVYYRPLAQSGAVRPREAVTLAGGWCWFSHVERIERSGGSTVIAATQVPPDVLSRLTAPRSAVSGLSMARPNLMGIVNVTPDSFSDGGVFERPEAAQEHALGMAAHGADILDIGGESTRPGAADVPVDEEIARTAPVIAAIRSGTSIPISIDTRKAAVAEAAMAAGASLINDVSAFAYDPDMARISVSTGAPVCLMHAQGDPATMQTAPDYEDALLDVYDALEAHVALALAAGIPLERIVVDPGIGFGKTVAHNLRILQGLSLFHGLGCAVLLGASRKRFIGTLGNEPDAMKRAPGSIAVALAGVAQGVQITRVHDIKETRQALRLWMAATGGEANHA